MHPLCTEGIAARSKYHSGMAGCAASVIMATCHILSINSLADPMSQTIKVALSSYGMSGRIFHAPFIEAHPHLELTRILERNKQDSQQRYPNARIVREYTALIEDPDIDLVVVNTPNPLHYSMTKAALLAGKHVVVEKPFTATVDEGRELIALAQERQLMLSVYHNRRLQSGFRTVRKLLGEGLIGALNTCEISIDRYRPEPGPKKWKEEHNPGAGLLYDLGSHLLDEALILFGLPQAVYADTRIERANGKVCDYFYIRLDYSSVEPGFPTGHKVILKASMLAREPGPAYTLHGNKGSYIKRNQDVQEARLAEGIQPVSPHWAQEDESLWGLLHTDAGRQAYATTSGAYEDFYNNIYRHLTVQEPLLVTADQALVVIAMIDLVQRSASEQARIELR